MIMKNSTLPNKQGASNSLVTAARVAFRKRVESEITALPQRLFGGARNCLRLRLSNRFILLLLRNGLSLKSTANEIRAALDALLTTPLTRLVACGQLTSGDVLMIRAKNKTHEIQIERISSRHIKALTQTSNH